VTFSRSERASCQLGGGPQGLPTYSGKNCLTNGLINHTSPSSTETWVEGELDGEMVIDDESSRAEERWRGRGNLHPEKQKR
jgi:hypothetical protein